MTGSLGDVAYSYFGASYVVGIKHRKRAQKVWALPPSTKSVYKTTENMPPFPTSHIPSALEVAQEPPPAGTVKPLRYLWIGMAGEWAGDYKSVKKAKGNPIINTVEESLRVVVKIDPKATQLKVYALMGAGDIKTPCVISNDLVFYFSEFSKDCQESGTKSGKRDLKGIWNKKILEMQAGDSTISAQAEDKAEGHIAGLKDYDAVDIPLPYEISLANRIDNAINLHILAPESQVLDGLVDFLEQEFPGLSDPPPSRALAVFFDFSVDLGYLDVPLTEYPKFGPFISDNIVDIGTLALKDKEVGAWYLACLVHDTIQRKFNIFLPIIELVKIRAGLRISELLLPFRLTHSFFAHARTLLVRHGSVDVSSCFQDVITIAGCASIPSPAPAATLSIPSVLAFQKLFRSLHTILSELVAHEKKSIVEFDKTLGNVAPAGSIEQIWTRYAAQSDIDSSRVMMKEMARTLHYYSRQRNTSMVKVLEELITQIDSVAL